MPDLAYSSVIPTLFRALLSKRCLNFQETVSQSLVSFKKKMMAQQNLLGSAPRLAAVACYIGIFLFAAFAQPIGKGVISGIVVDAESGDPVRKAIVTLTLVGTPRRWATARTDSSGHFEFEGLPAGKYDLRASKGDGGRAVNPHG